MSQRSTAPSRAEATSAPTELLADALERAIVVARRDASRSDAPPPPVPLRPMLRFTRLPARALQTVYEVLDEDDGFRAHVLEQVSEDELDRASWVFLARPEGWRDELELLGAVAQEELADEQADRAERTAHRRAVQLEQTLDRVRRELEHRTAELAALHDATAADRTSLEQLREQLVELSARAEQLDAGRARAVRELKDSEALADARLSQLREARERISQLERQLASATTTATETTPTESRSEGHGTPESPPVREALPEPPTSDVTEPGQPWGLLDPSAIADTVAAASAAATELSSALAAAAELLGAPRAAETSATGGTTPAGPPGIGSGTVGAAPAPGPLSPRARPPRRSPVRLRRGVLDASAEAVEQLLGIEDLVAFVDGYNVTMEHWPALGRAEQRASLVRALGALSARYPASIHVVFDGEDDGSRPSVGTPLPVRLHFSPAEVDADDVILSMVAALPTDVPVMVVSSDRRVADGARRLGANAVRSSQLIELLG